jgi:hypothetical protein
MSPRNGKLFVGSIAVAVVAVVLIAPAAWAGSSAPSYSAMQSAAYATTGGSAGGDAGVLQAQAAGVQIDPAAIPMMDIARPGSCLNDPLQSKCGPPPTAIVWLGGTTNGQTSTAAGTTTTIGGATSSSTAVTPDASPPCYASADGLELRSGEHNTTFMYGAGHTHCGNGITQQEADLVLAEYWTSDDEWHAEAGDYTDGGPGYLYVAASTTDCDVPASRDWRTVVVNTVDYQGTWYVSSDTKGPDSFDCVV